MATLQSSSDGIWKISGYFAFTKYVLICSKPFSTPFSHIGKDHNFWDVPLAYASDQKICTHQVIIKNIKKKTRPFWIWRISVTQEVVNNLKVCEEKQQNAIINVNVSHKLHTKNICNFQVFFFICNRKNYKHKSCIRETLNLSTDADKRTNKKNL